MARRIRSHNTTTTGPVDGLVTNVVRQKADDASQTVLAEGTATGVIPLGLAQGVVFKILVNSSAAIQDGDVELAAAAFAGEPDPIYKIGQNAQSQPLWNPSLGDWEDRNVWGFHGIQNGNIYYKFYNNGAVSSDFTISIWAQGIEIELNPEAPA